MTTQLPAPDAPASNGGALSGRVTSAAGDPAVRLIQAITPAVVRPVDELHVAAVLETTGVTDQAALDTYRHNDVFALASALYRRLPAAGAEAAPAGPVPGGSRRLLTHGLLYILPSTVYPAVLIWLGAAAMIRGMVFATTLGWVWGMGMSAVAYQLVGQGKDRSAGRALRLLGLGGLVTGLGGAVLLAAAGPGDARMAAFVVAQLSFQLGSGVLVFYGHELRVGLAMVPAVLTGIALFTSHYAPVLVGPALAAGGLSVLLLLLLAWVSSTRAPVRFQSPERTARRAMIAGAAPSVVYAILCAAFLLVTDARFLVGELDLAVAALPLILGMGMLEWRAHRFTDKVGQLWDRVALCGEFGRAAWWLLLDELGNCLAVLGGLGAILLLVLHETGTLSARGAMLIDAHVMLGGALFLGFILARYQQFGRLLAIMALVVAANLLLLPWATSRLAPAGAVPVFLFCTTALLAAQLIALRISFRRTYYYR